MKGLYKSTRVSTTKLAEGLAAIDENDLTDDPETTEAISAIAYGNAYLTQALAQIEARVRSKKEEDAAHGTTAEIAS